MEQLRPYHNKPKRREEFNDNHNDEENHLLINELRPYPPINLPPCNNTNTTPSSLVGQNNVGEEEEGDYGNIDDDAVESDRTTTTTTTSTITSNNNKWRNLLFGQFIAFIATSQNVISYALESRLGIVCPFFLMFPAYLLLSLHLLLLDVGVHDDRPDNDAVASTAESEDNPTTTSSSISSSNSSSISISSNNETTASATTQLIYKVPLTSIKIRVPFYYYIGLSILDVGPNYMILLALKRTSLTSVSLLGSLTIPSTMIACNFLLRQKFKLHHYIGVLCCLSGGIMTILADSFSHGGSTNNNRNDDDIMLEKLQHSTHSLTGDCLAILAAVLYGVTDALGEYWAKKIDRTEYLGMIGLLGCLFSALLTLFLEWDDIYHIFSNSSMSTTMVVAIIGLVVAYAIFLSGYYISATIFMVKCDATLLNLSLQASNLWAILFSTVAFQDAPPSQFYLAVILVASGVCIYELCNGTDLKVRSQTNADTDNDTDTNYQSIPLCNHI